jgi:hypothetical protein
MKNPEMRGSKERGMREYIRERNSGVENENQRFD